MLLTNGSFENRSNLLNQQTHVQHEQQFEKFMRFIIYDHFLIFWFTLFRGYLDMIDSLKQFGKLFFQEKCAKIVQRE